MTQVNRGERVFAIQSADSETINLLGFGTYVGDEVPPIEDFQEFNITNPKIILDDGRVVWGLECWWMQEARWPQFKGSRNVVEVRS